MLFQCLMVVARLVNMGTVIVLFCLQCTYPNTGARLMLFMGGPGTQVRYLFVLKGEAA